MTQTKPRESTRAAAAYAVYAAMGPGRSLAKLHLELKSLPEWTAKIPSTRRLEAWSARLGWQARVKEYDTARAEERRIAREALKDATNEAHFKLGDQASVIAVEQINRLIEAEKFGSQASVQLLKLATDLQRLALGLDKPETETKQPVGIQIIIETDNASVGLPGASSTLGTATVRELPAPSASVDAADDGVVEATVVEQDT